MVIEDEAIVLATKKMKERDMLIKCFTARNGLITGYYKMHSYRKVTIFVGSQVEISWHCRVLGGLGFYRNIQRKDEQYLKLILDRRDNILFNSVINSLLLSLNEREANYDIWQCTNFFLKALNNKGCHNHFIDSVVLYLIFQMQLLKNLGYALDLTHCVVTGVRAQLHYISPKSGCAVSYEAGASYADKLFLMPKIMYFIGDLLGKSNLDFNEICLSVMNYCEEIQLCESQVNLEMKESLKIVHYFLKKRCFLYKKNQYIDLIYSLIMQMLDKEISENADASKN